MHQRSAHEGRVIRASPVHLIGGRHKQTKTQFKHVRNILSAQRPERAAKAKKSVSVYKIDKINQANMQQLPSINTQMQEDKDKYVSITVKG